MRLAVISDIHGNLAALEAVLADLARRTAPDVLVNLGDCVTSPLWPRETYQLLERLGAPTVRGNHDRWLVDKPIGDMSRTVLFTYQSLDDRERAALGALPSTLRIDDDVLAVHGTAARDTEYLLEEAV